MISVVKVMNQKMKQLQLILQSDNQRAKKWLIQSKKTDNSAFALLNAWTEFEFQVKGFNLPSYRAATVKSRFMIDQCAETLNLPQNDIDRLFDIRNMRNGISHGLDKRSDPNWSDVFFLLDIVNRYKNRMTELGNEIRMEEE